MTFHREMYPALQNKTQLAKMALIEKKLSGKTFSVIGKNKVTMQKAKILNGDIIAFTTNQEGLDAAHVGFAVWQKKNLHLLHASSKEGSIVISPQTLITYLKFNRNLTGIIVARPLF